MITRFALVALVALAPLAASAAAPAFFPWPADGSALLVDVRSDGESAAAASDPHRFGTCGGVAPLVVECSTGYGYCAGWCVDSDRFVFRACGSTLPLGPVDTAPCYAGVLESHRQTSAHDRFVRCYARTSALGLHVDCDPFRGEMPPDVYHHVCKSFMTTERAVPAPLVAGGAGEWECAR